MGQFVKHGCHIAAIAIALCVALASTGALQAVHLSQCCGRPDASDSGSPCWRQQASAGHDSHTCAICTQFASAKNMLAGAPNPISVHLGTAKELVFIAVLPLQSVRLSSLLARAPPSICL